ncbi:MAG: hypothetical protein EBT08_01465 [Betaproteobacteria bacterium]|nr:hypothetical protein [Betaproteobacteria bacterium]
MNDDALSDLSPQHPAETQSAPLVLTPALSPAQRQALRAEAHPLKPVVMIGGAGLTEPVLAEIDRALNAHSLIKIRLLDADRDERQVLMDAICRQLGVQPVQAIGKLLVIYRKVPEAPVRERLTLRPRTAPPEPGRWRGPIRNATAPRGRPASRDPAGAQGSFRDPSQARAPARPFADRDAAPRRPFGDRPSGPPRAFGDRGRPQDPQRRFEDAGRPGHAPRAAPSGERGRGFGPPRDPRGGPARSPARPPAGGPPPFRRRRDS